MYLSDYYKAKIKERELKKRKAAGEDVEFELGKLQLWRHRVLWSRNQNVIYVQKIPSTPGLNEFILSKPNNVDLKLITSHCKELEQPFSDVPNIDFKESE